MAQRVGAVIDNKLKKFAYSAGFILVECGSGYGGKYGYTTKDSSYHTVCGFRTENSAINDWLLETFGDVAGKALKKILLESGVENEKTNINT